MRKRARTSLPICLCLTATLITLDQAAAAPPQKSNEPPKGHSQKKDAKHQMTVRELRFVRGIERKLVTKLNSKENPGDQKTWYALLFLDQVVARTTGASSSSSKRSVTLATVTAMKPDGTIIQGKRSAALAIARFLVDANKAARGLRAPSTGESRNRTRAAGNKRWWFVAFESKNKAEAFLTRVLPAQVTGKKSK